MSRVKFIDEIDGKKSSPTEIYKRGMATRKRNPTDCFEWSREAAIFGIPDAMQKVIEAYQKGEGVEPNARMAFEWLRKAADAKMDWAYYDLAKAYGDGLGTRIDVELFREWMTKASELKSGRDGLMELAKSYNEKKFGEPDPKKAFDWIRKMAAQGGAGAMIDLSQAYAVGARVALDVDEQLSWAIKAVAAAKKARKAKATDYGSQDLPFALSAVANAFNAKGQKAKAATQLKAAAKAAYQSSMEIGREAGDIALSNDLLEIMVRNQKSRESTATAEENFQSLLEIKAVAVGVYSSKDDCPTEISNAVVELANAYKNGLGTEASARESRGCLKIAKTLRSHYAMCILATTKNKREDLEAAAAAGSMEAFVRVEFDECRIASRQIPALVKLILNLQEAVYTHREVYHKVDENVDVAHYTGSSALEAMLGTSSSEPKNVMRMYNIAYLNDPGEGTRLFDPELDNNPLSQLWQSSNDPNEIDAVAEDHYVYIGSFSLVSDKLILWRAYTDDGNGFSIVTPSSAFAKDFSVPQMAAAWSSELKPAQRFTLYKVLYEKNAAQKAIDALRPTLKSLERKMASLNADQRDVVQRIARMVVSELRYLYKSEEYASEQEVRFVSALRLNSEYVKRDKTSPSAKLYAETRPFLFIKPGSKIVIGPTVDARASVAMALRQTLSDRGWDGACKVALSQVKYKKSSSQSA